MLCRIRSRRSEYGPLQYYGKDRCRSIPLTLRVLLSTPGVRTGFNSMHRARHWRQSAHLWRQSVAAEASPHAVEASAHGDEVPLVGPYTFTEPAPRQIQSVSGDVIVSVDMRNVPSVGTWNSMDWRFLVKECIITLHNRVSFTAEYYTVLYLLFKCLSRTNAIHWWQVTNNMNQFLFVVLCNWCYYPHTLRDSVFFLVCGI